MLWAHKLFFFCLSTGENPSVLLLPQPEDMETSTNILVFSSWISFLHHSFHPPSLPLYPPHFHISLLTCCFWLQPLGECRLFSIFWVHLISIGLELAALAGAPDSVIVCDQTCDLLYSGRACNCILSLFFRLYIPQNNPWIWNCITVVVHPHLVLGPSKVIYSILQKSWDLTFFEPPLIMLLFLWPFDFLYLLSTCKNKG